jgi:hypothetical protein
MRTLLVAVLAALAVLAANTALVAANNSPQFDIANCLVGATQFTRSSCIACNVAAALWCESAKSDELCGPVDQSHDSQVDSESRATRSELCTLCEDKTLYVTNTRAALNIIRHDCEACQAVAQRYASAVADAAEAASGESRTPEYSNPDCGVLCDLTACIAAVSQTDFESNTAPLFNDKFALQCREQILERCE